jgi:hypothetical protein
MYRINVVNSPTSQPLNVAAASQHQQQLPQHPHPHLQQPQVDNHHVPLQLVSNTATLQSPLILSHLGSNNNNILSTNHNINGGGGETSGGSGIANLNSNAVIDVSSVVSNNVNRLASNDEIMITAVKVEPVHDTIAGTSSNANNGSHYGSKRPRMEG